MSRTILLADDSVTIQKVIELTFMDEDYEVVAVGNGDEALEKLDEMTPDFVIADVHMPGASGYEVAKHSKSLRPEVPVLLLVSTFEPFDEEEAERSGCDAFLKKPFDSQELQRLVEELSAEASGDNASGPGDALAPGTESPEEPDAYEDLSAEPFSIGFDEEDEEPATRVPPPEEAVGSTAGRSAWGPSAEEPEAGATQAEPAVFEMAPEDFESAGELELEPEMPAGYGAVETEAPELSTSYQGAVGSGTGAGPAGAPTPPRLESPLSDEDVERIARRVVEILGDGPVREVAWEVVPDLAEVVIRDRLRELESQVEAGAD